jgi:hypothetical protein
MTSPAQSNKVPKDSTTENGPTKAGKEQGDDVDAVVDNALVEGSEGNENVEAPVNNEHSAEQTLISQGDHFPILETRREHREPQEEKEENNKTSTASADEVKTPTNPISQPNAYDVLLGRGKPFQNHNGNQEMLR